jgi:hypothetical protein
MMERIELYLLGKASLEELEAGRKRELARRHKQKRVKSAGDPLPIGVAQAQPAQI